MLKIKYIFILLFALFLYAPDVSATCCTDCDEIPGQGEGCCMDPAMTCGFGENRRCSNLMYNLCVPRPSCGGVPVCEEGTPGCTAGAPCGGGGTLQCGTTTGAPTLVIPDPPTYCGCVGCPPPPACPAFRPNCGCATDLPPTFESVCSQLYGMPYPDILTNYGGCNQQISVLPACMACAPGSSAYCFAMGAPVCPAPATMLCPDGVTTVTRGPAPGCAFPACPAVCPAPATQLCPDGVTTVTRNPAPACDFPACPAVCPAPPTMLCPDGVTTMTRDPFPGCGFPPCPTCIDNEQTFNISALPSPPMLFYKSTEACGGPVGVVSNDETFVVNVNTLPFQLVFPAADAQGTTTMTIEEGDTKQFVVNPVGGGSFTAVPTLSTLFSTKSPRIRHLYKSEAAIPACPAPATFLCPDGVTTVTRNSAPACDFPACPPVIPPVCPAPATLLCPDGLTTVVRNPAPACDFPACPPIIPPACIADGDVCKLAGQCFGGPEALDDCLSCCSMGMSYNVVVPNCTSDEKRCGSPVCAGPATQLCPDGVTTVTRNPFPACDFPACPAPVFQSCGSAAMPILPPDCVCMPGITEPTLTAACESYYGAPPPTGCRMVVRNCQACVAPAWSACIGILPFGY